MKNLLLILLAVSLFCCKRNEPAPQTDETPVDTTAHAEDDTAAQWSILPGEKIGNVFIGMESAKLEPLLGTPDLQDAAMGKAWQTWYSNSAAMTGKNELNIFTAYKDQTLTEKVVRLIRVTSPDFDASGISTGSSLDSIQWRFPEAGYVAAYPYATTKKFVEVYDDSESGIAFEVLESDGKNRCIAILVHPASHSVLLDYRTFRPDLVIK